MGSAKEYMAEVQEEMTFQNIATVLGISYEELQSLDVELLDHSSEDGLHYSFYLEFGEECDPEILGKIKGLENGRYVYLPQWDVEFNDNDIDWEIKQSDHLKIFSSHLESVESLLEINLDEQTSFNLLVMLHAHIIASVEHYLSSIFIHTVINSDKLIRKLIETDPELGRKEITLKEIYLHHEELKVTVASYLKELIFHKMNKIKPMYEEVLGYKFDDISWLFKGIVIRHHCVHRAGYDKEDKKVAVSVSSIRDLIVKSQALINLIDGHILASKEADAY